MNLSKNPHTPSEEPGGSPVRSIDREESFDLRRGFSLSGEEIGQLGRAIVADGDDEARPSVNAFWLAAGQRQGFVWTTVADVQGYSHVDGIHGAVSFTAEIEEPPARLTEDETAWLEVSDILTANPCPELTVPLDGNEAAEGELFDQLGRWVQGLMRRAWGGGRMFGLIQGEAMGRYQGRPEPWPGRAGELAQQAFEMATSLDGLEVNDPAAVAALLRAVAHTIVEIDSALASAMVEAQALSETAISLTQDLRARDEAISTRDQMIDGLTDHNLELIRLPTPSPVEAAEAAADRLEKVWLFVGPELAAKTADSLERLVVFARTQTRRIAGLEAALAQLGYMIVEPGVAGRALAEAKGLKALVRTAPLDLGDGK
jgi:hypothetical protein